MPEAGVVPGTDRDLPGQLTSFIGREVELRQLRELLHTARLLTLTGPGGSGKTRLGIRLAEQVAGEFSDGVVFVPLGAVGDPDLVLSTIAHATGLGDSGDRPLADRLATHLCGKETLLLLDNFEHLVTAAPAVTWLLRAAPAMRIVVTSRRALRVTGEQEYDVAPLPVPSRGNASTAEIASVESVRLFVERARAAAPGFALDDDNAPVVAGIARRLDGLPLAIELAAARIKLLPPAALLVRLDDSLRLLVVGPRDLPPRQRTLRATIAWSHGLLRPDAQRLLAVCSVFRGGIDLVAVEQVCGRVELGVESLAAMEELVGLSLLRPVTDGDGARFGMLETVREYAAERLSAMPEMPTVQAAHAGVFLALAETATPELRGPGERRWLTVLDTEHQNLRTALDWFEAHSPAEALRLAAALSRFWAVRGHFTEGRQRLLRLLGACPEPSVTRVRALTGAALLAIDQGDYEAAADLLDQAIRLARELGDVSGEATALVFLGRSFIARGGPAEGVVPVEHAVRLLAGGDDPAALGLALLYAGLAAQFTGRLEEAASRYRRSVEICRELGWRSWGARSLELLGHALLEMGEVRAARAALEEALPICVDVGDRWVVPIVMVGFAGVAARTGRPRRALTLAGAAQGLCASGQFTMPPVIAAELERWMTPARAQIGRDSASAFDVGLRMSEPEAVAYALADGPEPAGRPASRQTLTSREAEVAALVAQGLTNRAVAARLHVSTRTVDTHVDHVLTKLGFSSRTQLGAWAYEENLLRGNR